MSSSSQGLEFLDLSGVSQDERQELLSLVSGATPAVLVLASEASAPAPLHPAPQAREEDEEEEVQQEQEQEEEDKLGVEHEQQEHEQQAGIEEECRPPSTDFEEQAVPFQEQGAAAKEAWLKSCNCHHDAFTRQKKLKSRSGSLAVTAKPWKYQQMEFLLPYMTNREGSSNVTWTESNSQQTADGYINSDEQMSTQPTTASQENLTTDAVHDGDNDDAPTADEEGTIPFPSPHPKKAKKWKIVDSLEKKTDLAALCKQSIVSHEERARNSVHERKKMEEKLEKIERDPLYHFFISMYATSAKLSPASQHRVKREIFWIISNEEEMFLDMLHSSHSLPGHTTCVSAPSNVSTVDIPKHPHI